MSKWPVRNPPVDLHPPHINLTAQPPDPVTFDGPLNELIELHGTAQAYINVAHTKDEYLDIVPVPSVPTAPTPPPLPTPQPISAGNPVPIDESKYVIVRNSPPRPRPPRPPPPGT
jgi:hypothetical protein